MKPSMLATLSIVLAALDLLLACSSEGNIGVTAAATRKSAAGESCAKTADCDGTLHCVGGLCIAPLLADAQDAAASTDAVDSGGQTADAANEPAGHDALGSAEVSAAGDAAADAGDACVPVCTGVSCTDGCGGACTDQVCDDGNACTTGDACTGAGACVGKAAFCNDKNDCTTDTCDPAKGCKYVNNAAACDDGNLCTIGDLCKNGACAAGQTKSCDSGNACLTGSCDVGDGKCKFSNAKDGLPCDDGTACTTDDACAAGKCTGKTADCNDSNPCTDDTCEAKGGCAHSANTASCDDGNGCTVGDACASKNCLSGAAKVCADSSPCTLDGCDVLTGDCVFQGAPFEGSACDADGSACTNGDACKGGVCAAGPGLDCNDGNVCTDDSCTTIAGCGHGQNQALCNADGNACTPDSCQGGKCLAAGSALVCNDNNVCTIDSCDASTGKCVFSAADTEGHACDADGSVCTGGDACSAGVCKPGKEIVCDDGNICSDDTCDAASGCEHAANQLACETDGSACTVEVCKERKCVTVQTIGCNDGNPCTVDKCDPVAGQCGFTAAADGGACNADDSECTVGDACKKGMCVAGTTISCDDSNLCTDDACQQATGCVHLPNAVTCDTDGSACTAEVCKAGKCSTGVTMACNDNNTCTTDKCDAKTGSCIFTTVINGTTCDVDGSVCTAVDTCQAGVCTAGALVNCQDGSVCTDDSCDAVKGCVHNANNAVCDADQNLCTSGDSCAGGTCVAGKVVACSDNNPCTVDACDAKTGTCVFSAPNPDGTACDADGSVCTVGDQCTAGVCVAGPAKVCNDGNACTDDSCDVVKGCVTVVNAAVCDADQNGCTVGDACAGGACAAGEAVDCDDGDPCTADSCLPLTGACQNVGGAGQVVLQPGPADGKDTDWGTVYHQSGMPDAETLYNGGWGDMYYDYLQFDVMKTPVGGTVVGVQLQLYSAGASVNNPALAVQRITQPWTEAGVTSSNHPTAVAFGACGPTGSGWTTCDITDLYKGWVNGTFANYGVVLVPSNTNQTNGAFAASENADPTIRPKLVITSTCAKAPPDGPLENATSNTGPTILLNGAGNVTVLYQDAASGYSNVKMAEYTSGWQVSSPFAGYGVIKDAADVDAIGTLHLAMSKFNANGAYYGTGPGTWAATVIPTIPAAHLTGAVDSTGKFHVTSDTHLSTRYYATNASGAWVTAQVASTSSAPASLVTDTVLAPTMAYNIWSGHVINVASAPNWSSGQTLIETYGVDQGPPVSLKVFNHKLNLVYAITTDSYTSYSVLFKTNASGSWLGTPLKQGSNAVGGLDLTVGASGARHVVTCNDSQVMSYYSDRTGAWKAYTIASGACESSPLDTLSALGRVFVAYRGTDAKLKVLSFNPNDYN